MKKSIALILALVATLFAAPNATSKASSKASKAEAVKKLIDQGVQFHEQGQYDEALAKYKEAEKKDPKNALVKYEMAFTYHAKRDLDKSLSYARAATKLKAEGIEENLYSLLGTVYDDKGMPDSALAVYREAFAKLPNSVNIPYNASITYMRMNNADSAYAWIKRSINNSRVHEGSHYYMGFLASQMGKWPQFYAYTMYSTFISKKAEIIRDNLSRLYGRTKSFVLVKDKKV